MPSALFLPRRTQRGNTKGTADCFAIFIGSQKKRNCTEATAEIGSTKAQSYFLKSRLPNFYSGGHCIIKYYPSPNIQPLTSNLQLPINATSMFAETQRFQYRLTMRLHHH